MKPIPAIVESEHEQVLAAVRERYSALREAETQQVKASKRLESATGRGRVPRDRHARNPAGHGPQAGVGYVVTFDPVTNARVRAAAYRCSARLPVRCGEHSAAAVLNARAARLVDGVPEPLATFGGAM